MRDRRLLAYAEFGDPVGKPVFYFHGSNGSRLERHPDESIAVSLGARVITVDRPGHGRSDFHPDHNLLDWPDDVEELADALGIGPFAVVGFSAGGPHAAACAYKIPHRITAAGVVSSFAPYDRSGATKAAKLYGRVILGLARRAPWILAPVLGLMSRMVHFNPALIVNQMGARMTSYDRALMVQPDIRGVLIESISESFRPGSRGLLAEVALLVRPWGFRLEDIQMQVYLWHSEIDPVVPLQMGLYLARGIPNCRATFIPGEGHILILSQWRQILSAVVS